MDGNGSHNSKCYLNLVKAMKKADGPIALDFLRVEGLSSGLVATEEIKLERLLWTSMLLYSQSLRRLWAPYDVEVNASYDKIDILDLDGDIGTCIYIHDSREYTI
jgi:hypothetical protein